MRDRAEKRQRAMALALAVLLHLIVFSVLVFVRSRPEPVKMGSRLKGFMLMPEAKEKGEQKAAQAKTEKRKTSQTQAVKADAAQPPPPTPKPEVPDVPTHNKLPFILMSSEDLANGNIAGKQSAKQASAASGSAKADYGPGEGPGGANLYAADWYREPTDTELAGYLPANAPRSGWGMIACKTIERFHVDDCITLGESPAGSGYARAVREAAWQFLVLPPRINGKAQIGAWVRIRITYSERGIGLGG